MGRLSISSQNVKVNLLVHPPEFIKHPERRDLLTGFAPWWYTGVDGTWVPRLPFCPKFWKEPSAMSAAYNPTPAPAELTTGAIQCLCPAAVQGGAGGVRTSGVCGFWAAATAHDGDGRPCRAARGYGSATRIPSCSPRPARSGQLPDPPPPPSPRCRLSAGFGQLMLMASTPLHSALQSTIVILYQVERSKKRGADGD